MSNTTQPILSVLQKKFTEKIISRFGVDNALNFFLSIYIETDPYPRSGIKTKYEKKTISSTISSQQISGKNSECK